jgi:hypothetical protein
MNAPSRFLAIAIEIANTRNKRKQLSLINKIGETYGHKTVECILEQAQKALGLYATDPTLRAICTKSQLTSLEEMLLITLKYQTN